MKRNVLFVIPVALLCGCSPTNISNLVKAVAKDPATVTIKVSSVYGTVSYTRVGLMTNETASVASDGSVILKSGTHQ